MLHVAKVVEKGGSAVSFRWECSCGRPGAWMTSRSRAAKNGRMHETRRNAARL